ncbi:GNAT family N-acetyltransferase [Gloeobacter kilaueensis]|uniref:GCN5-related N-acetyltransferase n=1 Tax=Gloeobacter kilaueensis (strain ATCC BAA-2537 / CCAP 1431/1 / ULC 316 / JS1) TaxID=1183438 RepID=U5QJB8_GLOK1|nr:GNAT family N-acetyltransferase [Gloeobacter kilaueensis]AGY59077.1 GCN5-related N-acetyltransferase [Gloeobacter kilaueensis JS1]
MTPAWHEEAIARHHDRKAFDCGDQDLNNFLRHSARQSHDRGGAKTFLAIGDSDGSILGFYSVAPAELAYARTPEVVRRGLAKHAVPGFRLARLAVHVDVQKKGLGGQLLLAAGRRCLRTAAEVGGVVLLIDAKSPPAASWYAGFGAVALEDAPLTLMLPLETIEISLRAAEKL